MKPFGEGRCVPGPSLTLQSIITLLLITSPTHACKCNVQFRPVSLSKLLSHQCQRQICRNPKFPLNCLFCSKCSKHSFHTFPTLPNNCSFTQSSVIYQIVCRPTKRTYIGNSRDPHTRFQQHMRKPPLRMKGDLQEYGTSAFYIHTLAGCVDKGDAKFLEKFYIRKFSCTGALGYNNLPGDPASSRKFWAMVRRAN